MGNFYLDDTIQTQVIQLHLEMYILSSPTCHIWQYVHSAECWEHLRRGRPCKRVRWQW